MKANNKAIGISVLTAITASLCCITPVLALIAGASGMASAFSWLEPARPYLIGLSGLVLGFAWYQKLKPRTKEEIECACEEGEKISFWQSKKFLGIVTVFAIVMLVFPLYAHLFYPAQKTSVIIVDNWNIEEVSFDVEGMTCTGCEAHVKHAVTQLPGIIGATADWKEGTAMVKFDKKKTSVEEVIAAIDETEYKVTSNSKTDE